MTARVHEWMALATERLADSSTPLYLIPGNDDEFAIDEALNTARLRTDQRRRQGAGHPRRSAAAVQRLVEQHAVGDSARGDRGAAVRAARRARPAGARPAPRDLHDPRAAPRLRARRGAAAGREPAADDLRRRCAARPGRLDRGTSRSSRSTSPCSRSTATSTSPAASAESAIPSAINPGSEANHGILRGYLVDIGKKGVELAQRVEG